jgi:hypothetical protein
VICSPEWTCSLLPTGCTYAVPVLAQRNRAGPSTTKRGPDALQQPADVDVGVALLRFRRH